MKTWNIVNTNGLILDQGLFGTKEEVIKDFNHATEFYYDSQIEAGTVFAEESN